eukprot:SAG31_NODE_7_length_42755_cov_130.245728_16_plen_202_part_00
MSGDFAVLLQKARDARGGYHSVPPTDAPPRIPEVGGSFQASPIRPSNWSSGSTLSSPQVPDVSRQIHFDFAAGAVAATTPSIRVEHRSLLPDSPHEDEFPETASMVDADAEVVQSLCLEYPCAEPGHVRTTDVPAIICELSRIFGEMPPSSASLAAVLRQLDSQGSSFVSSVARAGIIFASIVNHFFFNHLNCVCMFSPCS